MDDPQVLNAMAFGYHDKRKLLWEQEQEKLYIEDIYGEEIHIGDAYFETPHGLVHVNSSTKYMADDYVKKVRE